MVNKKRLIRLTRQLIRIDSQNPPGNESKIARFVHNYLKNLGLKTKVYEFKKGRANVVAHLPGRDKRYSLLITPHLDTVPSGGNWHFNPFLGEIDRGRIYGLGATDCKGNLACALETIQSLVENNISLDYNLVFAATADEENGSGQGLVPLLEKGILRPDVAVVLDADDFAMIVTQKGLIHLKLKIAGKKAHAAYPWRGKNAIEISLRIINDLKRCKLHYPQNKYLKPPTMNIGTIKGGDKVNVVADWCESELDFRFLPGMSAKKILKQIRTIVQRHTEKFKIEIQAIQRPYQINAHHPLIDYLSEAMKEIKVKPTIKGSEGATTITLFQKMKIPAIATGFGSLGCAHIRDEYVKINNLYKGAKVLEAFLKLYKFIISRGG